VTAAGDWDAALDAFAERLAEQRAAITTRAAEVGEFTPPDGLGPLPERLRERAARLVEESEAVTAALEAAAARIERELAALERSARSTPPPIPSFFDHRA
jgi:hypothetical protein